MRRLRVMVLRTNRLVRHDLFFCGLVFTIGLSVFFYELYVNHLATYL